MVAILNSRLSLQPPYDFTLKQYEKIIESTPLQKDKVHRAWYYLNQMMIEDPTKFLHSWKFQPNYT